MGDLSPRSERLLRELLHQRDMAGISARGLADKMGVDRGRVQRIDTFGLKRPPAMPFVRAWLDACGTSAEERTRILDLAEAAHGETRPYGELLSGVPHLQRVAAEREQPPGMVRNFQPTIIPGLLQTPEYAARVLPLADITGTTDHAGALAKRLERQRALYEEGHRFEFLLLESALRWSVQMAELGRTQLDRVVSLSNLSAVELGVIPVGAEQIAPWHNFVLWEPDGDDPYVTTELFHGEQQMGDSETVEVYRGVWRRLWGDALTGDEGRALVELVAREMRVPPA